MERIQATVLAVLIAALVLFGLGYILDEGGMLAWRGGGSHDERARIALWNEEGGWETRRPNVQPPAGGETRGGRSRRGGLGGGAGDAGDGGRRRGVFFDEGTIGADGEPRRGMTRELVAARTGMLPAGPTGRDHPSQPQAPAAPPNQDDETDPELLLSVPFDGSVNGENGDQATVAEGVLFNGDSVEFTDQARVVFPAEGNVDSSAGTISFDVTPRWSGTDPSNNSLLQVRDGDDAANSLQIVKNLGTLRFIITDWRGLPSEINVPITDWLPGDRHHIDATWTGGEMVLYVDDVSVGTAQVQRGMRFADSASIQVGSAGSIYGGAGGLIRDLQIRANALSGDQIAGTTRMVQLQVEEVARH
ncbi:MAG: LamG-like jellyroll fold domain-containing protein [Deltaproteobacteria bacterium]|nr:LamG-like jellyroll fold domain-containing protein [Deltaproteobacteria bacterium]